jgi:hypothetical protein
MAPVYRELSGKRHIFGPGDILTLHYVFHPETQDPGMDLLAARSLIYSKLLEKEEMVDSSHPHPHTKNEIETIRAANALTMKDCETIFPTIRFAPSVRARKIVEDFFRRRPTENM